MLFNITPNQTDVDQWREFIELLEFRGKIIKFRLWFLIIISLFITLGNSMVLLATWKERILHQPNKYFVACLAVADLLVGGFIAPMSAQRQAILLKEQRGVESIHRCRFEAWITTLARTASVLSLVLISVDRYLKISRPLLYTRKMTTSTCLKLIIVIWLMSTALGTYTSAPFSGSVGHSVLCNHTKDDEDKVRVFFTIIATCLLLLTVVILIMYALIFFVAHKRQRRLRNGELGETVHEQNQRSTFLQDLKVIRALFLVVGVFIICWYPYLIFIYLCFYFPEMNFWKNKKLILLLRQMVDLLPLVNSLCNPIIYTRSDEKYKEAFKRLFQQMKSLVCRKRSEV